MTPAPSPRTTKAGRRTARLRLLGPLALVGLALASIGAGAQMAEPGDRFRIAATVSPAAADGLKAVYAGSARLPARTRPESLADWDRQAAQLETLFLPRAQQFAASTGTVVTPDTIGGVPVLRIRPAGYRPSRRLLIYLHGGAYVRFSARSALITPALIAAASGDEVISVDYTLAPRATWRATTDQVLAVWRAVLAGGARPGSIGMLGDSAGGGLAAGAVLKMRDQGLPLPAALWLLSPWADLTVSGDTHGTLGGVDPVLSPVSEAWAIDAYAAVEERRNPYVSPVFGDYAKAFPPTLIQAGTREMLLSDAVREYQAIRGGGHEAVLDVYEGMPHVFQATIPTAPESRTAVARAAAFFKAHLVPR